MFKVSVMYPNQDGTRFDMDYYRTKHMELVRKHMSPFGLVRTEVAERHFRHRRAARTVYLHRQPVFRNCRRL